MKMMTTTMKSIARPRRYLLHSHMLFTLSLSKPVIFLFWISLRVCHYYLTSKLDFIPRLLPSLACDRRFALICTGSTATVVFQFNSCNSKNNGNLDSMPLHYFLFILPPYWIRKGALLCRNIFTNTFHCVCGKMLSAVSRHYKTVVKIWGLYLMFFGHTRHLKIRDLFEDQ